MNKIVAFFLLAFSNVFFSQILIPAYQNRVNQITQTNINSYLTEFSNLGVKKTGTSTNNAAFTWLKNKYLSFGYAESDISENAFTYSNNSTKNLILTKTGTKYPNIFVIVCGHYDTIVGPGVNDNGSGTAILLEMARILKNIPTDYSIKFINFTGEEQGLLGSQNYVNTVVNGTNPKMNIKLVLNIDQVGGTFGEINNTITCERDTSSPTSNNAQSAIVTQELMNCFGLYSTLQTNLSYAYSSDYMPFQSNGEIITGLYEFNESIYPHSAIDTYANMDPVFVYNVCKGALGSVQHFSVASTTDLGTVDCTPKKMLESLKITPNPAHDFLLIEMINLNLKDFTFTIIDGSGKTLIKAKNQRRIDISLLKNGIYFGTMNVEDQIVTKKILIKK